MKKSGIILVAMAFIVAVASLAATAGAQCTTCGGEENWEASAASFLEGKPINDEPSSLSNPQQSRIRNDFNSNLLEEGADDSPAKTPIANIQKRPTNIAVEINVIPLLINNLIIIIF